MTTLRSMGPTGSARSVVTIRAPRRASAAEVAAAAAARDDAVVRATNTEFDAEDSFGQGMHPDGTFVKGLDSAYTQKFLALDNERFNRLESKTKARENVRNLQTTDTNLELLKAPGRRLVALENF